MLKGIETQIMVTRTTDMTRDAGALQRKNELVRDYLATQTQALAEQQKQQVAQTLNAQDVVIHKDKQEKNRQEREQRDEEAKELALADDEYIILPSGNHNIIDIKV